MQLRTFYRKRALRIFPAYLAVLALYFLWTPWRDGSGLQPLWQFLTFTVNLLIDYPTHNSFSHVWSLCVEEHFYLLLPCIVLVLARRPSARKTLLVMAGVLIFGMTARAWAVLHLLAPLDAHNGRVSAPFVVAYMGRVYYPTYSRLDGLLVGVALATVQIFRPGLWTRLARWSTPLLLSGVAVVGLSLYMFQDRFVSDTGKTAFSTVFGFPLLSASLGLLVFSAAVDGAWLSRTRVPLARPLATIAYSLYLSHKSVANVLYHYQAARMDAHPALTTLVLFPLCFACAGVLYLAVERPFLVWRDQSMPWTSRSLEARVDPAL